MIMFLHVFCNQIFSLCKILVMLFLAYVYFLCIVASHISSIVSLVYMHLLCIVIFEPVREKTNNLGSDTKWAVQSQKMVRG